MKRNIMIMILLVLISSTLSFSQPSAWAEKDVELSISNGLVPVNLQVDYQNNITREEFSTLIVQLYETINNAEVEIPSNAPFVDTKNEDVMKAYGLGIVTGKGEGVFAPTANISRQEIAVMFNRTLEALDFESDTSKSDIFFEDSSEIDAWAKVAIERLYGLGVISGVGNNQINPLGNATREQAILLCLRTYNLIEKPILSSVEIAKLSKSVVKFHVEGYDGSSYTGSGFFYDQGKVATNFHVIMGAKSIVMEYDDESLYEGPFVVTGFGSLGYDDMLTLSVTDMTTPALAMGDSSKILRGERVFAIGSPVGLLNTVSDGIVSSVRENEIQTTAPISPGSSGGVLLNEFGQVVGITTSGIVEGENLGFAIPINNFKDLDKSQSMSLLAFYNAMHETGKKAPSYLKATIVSESEVHLHWDDTGADYYEIYLSENGNDFYALIDKNDLNEWTWNGETGLIVSGFSDEESVNFAIASISGETISEYTYSNAVQFAEFITLQEVEDYLNTYALTMPLGTQEFDVLGYELLETESNDLLINCYLDYDTLVGVLENASPDFYEEAFDLRDMAIDYGYILGRTVIMQLTYYDYYDAYEESFDNNYIYPESIVYDDEESYWSVYYPLIQAHSNYSTYHTFYGESGF